MARVNIDKSLAKADAKRLALPHVIKVSNQVLRGSKHLAPRGTHRSGSGTARTGASLVASLRSIVTVESHGVVGRIGSPKKYAGTIHQGSSPHWIRSNGGMLKFKWERGNLLVVARRRGRISSRYPSRARNGFFYFHRVRHPGNKRPVRYLTTPLVVYGKAAGFKVSTGKVSRTFLP